MSKYEDIEGAVPVDGDITPITRQPIESVDANAWSKMAAGELFDQKAILEKRRILAASCGSDAMLKEINRGIRILEELIKNHKDDEVTLL